MDLKIVKGSKEDLHDFIRLLNDVHNAMEQKEWFYLDSPEEFWRLMESGAMELWLAKDGERIAAAFDLLIPGLQEYNYGYVMDFSREELEKVVNMDSAAVHPDYRGLGLQRKLLQTAENWLKEQGKWTMLCTIHPDNQFSLQNALHLGYTIRKKVDIYGSVRYILSKEI